MDIGKLNGLLAVARQTGEETFAQATALLQSFMGAPAASAPRPAAADTSAAGESAFLAETYEGPEGRRPYKLFVPGGYHGQPVPLIVMLHGCGQSPDDFAAGTRMNGAAETHCCIVVYPGQVESANAGRCWNWFNAGDQRRDHGEAALLADLVRGVARRYAIDPARIYAAGLSAGGAAAAVLGATYPELFAAIGVHSGLPCGAARDMQSGFMAMGKPSQGRKLSHSLPAIVFHGDRDNTVHPGNADGVIIQAMAGTAVHPRVHQDRAPGGRSFIRTEYLDSFGKILLEQWVVLGGDHAWSGGSSDGSFTDPRGPDATFEMMRFFLAHPKAA